MSLVCPHGMIVGRCVIGCHEECRCGRWVLIVPPTPSWYTRQQDSRRRRGIIARAGRALVRMRRRGLARA